MPQQKKNGGKENSLAQKPGVVRGKRNEKKTGRGAANTREEQGFPRGQLPWERKGGGVRATGVQGGTEDDEKTRNPTEKTSNGGWLKVR